MAAITPKFMFDFQSNLNAKYANGYKRVLKNLWWDRIAFRQHSMSRIEFYEWMLETAQIRPTGSKGTELTFEDLASIGYSIKNKPFGTALKLNRDDLEDDKYEKAPQWAANAGSDAAYHPQRQIVQLIRNGKTKGSYDGVPFFSSSHPVNPFDSLAGVYSNLFTNKKLSAENVAGVMAEIAKVKLPSGTPRYLRPTILLVDPSNALVANTITGAEIISDPTGDGTASATNVIKQSFGFAQPIVADELADEPGVWYVGVEADEDAMQGAFVYQERKPFELNSYTGMTEAQLDRINEFEWHVRGRNEAAYGHPYLFYRVEPTSGGGGGG